MRRRLLLVTLAVTTLVVAAFAVPLALLVREVAHDRALTEAERDLSALAPVLAVAGDDPPLLAAAIERTATGRDGRMGAWLADGTRVGDTSPADPADVSLARDGRRAFSRDVAGGEELYSPVVVGDGDVVVLRARVPQDLLSEGVPTSWTILAVLAIALLGGAVLASDQLARSVTRPAASLAATSRALATGDPTARAEVTGPPEIAAVAEALNLLADRIDELRASERERVADLSHRLRTPLTALRLDAEASGVPALVDDVDRLAAEVTEVIRAARRPLHEQVVGRCDLAAVAAERAAFWGALAEDDHREWTLAGTAREVMVRVAEPDAAAAVDVLIGNVFAHTPEGTPYSVSLHVDGGRAVLAVEDAGPGIDDLERVLDRGVSAAGSSGLGLDIARSTAEAAAGALRVSRSRWGGARVELDLPIAGSVG